MLNLDGYGTGSEYKILATSLGGKVYRQSLAWEELCYLINYPNNLRKSLGSLNPGVHECELCGHSAGISWIWRWKRNCFNRTRSQTTTLSPTSALSALKISKAYSFLYTMVFCADFIMGYDQNTYIYLNQDVNTPRQPAGLFLSPPQRKKAALLSEAPQCHERVIYLSAMVVRTQWLAAAAQNFRV